MGIMILMLKANQLRRGSRYVVRGNSSTRTRARRRFVTSRWSVGGCCWFPNISANLLAAVSGRCGTVPRRRHCAPPAKRAAPILRGSRPGSSDLPIAQRFPLAAGDERAPIAITLQITFDFSALLSVNVASPVWGRVALESLRILRGKRERCAHRSHVSSLGHEAGQRPQRDSCESERARGRVALHPLLDE